MQNKIGFCLLLLSLTTASFGQLSQSDTVQSAPPVDYLKKSRHQKTAAWILTGLGTAGLVTTLGADMGQAVGDGFVTIFTLGTVEPEYKSYTGYYLVSAACIGAGIAYFVAASKNKRKAAALNTTTYFKMEKAYMVYGGAFHNQYYPAVAVSIHLP